MADWYTFPGLVNQATNLTNIRTELAAFVGEDTSGRTTFDVAGALALAVQRISAIADPTPDAWAFPFVLRSTDVSSILQQAGAQLSAVPSVGGVVPDLAPLLADCRAKSEALTNYYNDAYSNLLPAILNEAFPSGVLDKNVPQAEPTEKETRYYRTTFVNDWENESAPSPVSEALEVGHKDTVTVAVGAVPVGRNLAYWRVYRSNSGSENAAFQYVPNTADDLGVPVATATFEDDQLNSNLQEVLPSTIWDHPPANLRGLVGMANGIHVGFFDNVLCPSESYTPWAFPTDYQITVEWNIVALCPWEQAVFVGTEGKPYFVVGSDAASLTAALLDSNQSCVSPRSVCATAAGVVYASPDGLCLANPGGVRIITDGIFTREEWQALNPETLQVAEHDGTLYLIAEAGAGPGLLYWIEFGTDGITTPPGTSPAAAAALAIPVLEAFYQDTFTLNFVDEFGMEVFAPSRGTTFYNWITAPNEGPAATPFAYALHMASGRLTTMDLAVAGAAMYRDLMTDTLYVASAFDLDSIATETLRTTGEWAKRVTLDQYCAYKWVQVDSDFLDADGTTPVTVTVTLLAEDGTTVLSTTVVGDREPKIMVPTNVQEYVLRVTSKARVTTVRLTSTMKEMKSL